VDNTLIHETAPSDLAGRVGLVFDNPFNQISGTRFTVRDEIAFGLENLGLSRHEMLDRVEAILEKVGLNGLADRSPFALSGGQQQRLALASVMVMEPEILVLDEPTSQLDPSGTREVFETLRALTSQSGITVVLASHKLDRIAAYADRVVALHSGEIALDGPPNEVLTSAELSTINLRPTRYTEIASAAQSLGLVASNTRLPVDLQEAQNVFALH
jgi:energy-coupling factor transporter ATP-binding protein EcfA2